MVYLSPLLGLLKSYKVPWPITPPGSPPKKVVPSLPANDLDLPSETSDHKAASEESSPVYAPISPPRRLKTNSPPQQKSPTRRCLTLTAIQTLGLPTPPPTPPESPSRLNRKSPPSSPRAFPATCHVELKRDSECESVFTDSVQSSGGSPLRPLARHEPESGTAWGGLYSNAPKIRAEDEVADQDDIQLSVRRQTATKVRVPLSEVPADEPGRRGRPPKQHYASAVIDGAEYFNMAIYRTPSRSESVLQHRRTLLRIELKSAETKTARASTARRTKSPTDDPMKDPSRQTNRMKPINLLKVEQSRLRFYRDVRSRRAKPVVPEPRSLNANVTEPPAKYHTSKLVKHTKLSQCVSFEDIRQSAKKAKKAALRRLAEEIDGPVNYGLGLDFGRLTSSDQLA